MQRGIHKIWKYYQVSLYIILACFGNRWFVISQSLKQRRLPVCLGDVVRYATVCQRVFTSIRRFYELTGIIFWWKARIWILMSLGGLLSHGNSSTNPTGCAGTAFKLGRSPVPLERYMMDRPILMNTWQVCSDRQCFAVPDGWFWGWMSAAPVFSNCPMLRLTWAFHYWHTHRLFWSIMMKTIA